MEKNNNPKNTDAITLVARACAEVQGFEELYRRLKRRMHTQRHKKQLRAAYCTSSFAL